MKTKRFISKLRAASEFAALCVLALAMIMLIICETFSWRNLTAEYWPIVAFFIFAYAILSYWEDYLNKRILNGSLSGL